MEICFVASIVNVLRNYFSIVSPCFIAKTLSPLVSQGVTFAPTQAYTFGARTALYSELLVGNALQSQRT